MTLANTVPAVLLGDGSFWLPPPDSSTAPAMDRVFYLILWICVVFFFLVVALHDVLRDRLSAAAGTYVAEDGHAQQCAGNHLDRHPR